MADAKTDKPEKKTKKRGGPTAATLLKHLNTYLNETGISGEDSVQTLVDSLTADIVKDAIS